MKKQDKKPPHLFPGDSPASPFPAPGNNGDLRTNGIYGPKCSALSGNCTPLGCLEKMLLASSIWGSTRRFLTWSRQAFVLPAVAVGAWHERKRTFIIGHAASHAPCQRHGGCGENCRCADDPDRELPKIQSQRNRMDGAAVMGGLQTAGQPAGGCETEPRLGGMADGIPPEMDGHSMWAKEPAQIPYLISDPPANVAKRLKTLGNAVVPPQVYPILRYIAEIETGRCRNRQQGGDRIWNP